jgi:anti-sigma regulatory factor (Ser/Thr protein kinase)
MIAEFDSYKDCKLLFDSAARNESALILLRAKLTVIAQRLGISEIKTGNILLAASELVSNNIKYAGGRGMIQVWQQPGPVLDLVSLDFGPGIPDLGKAEQDGFSTANTLGKGLGSVRRLSDELHIYTQLLNPGQQKKWSGSVFLARFFPESSKNPEQMRGFRIGLYSRAMSDSRYNGDRIYLRQNGKKLRWLHLDGLGHGELAQEATDSLANRLAHGNDPVAILEAVDHQLQGSRGAVAVSGEVDLGQQALQIAGVGDMHAHICEMNQVEGVPFSPGVLGREHRTLSVLQSGFTRHGLVITASDGIRRNWDNNTFAGLFSKHPQLIAYTMGNIMGRVSDDQSLCVLAAA